MSRGKSMLLVTFVALTLALGMGGSLIAAGKTLEYYSMWYVGEDQQKVLSEAIADFEKAKAVKINVTWVGRDVLTKARSKFLTDSPPDLIDQDLNELAGALLGESELALVLNDLLNSRGPEGQAKFTDVLYREALRLYDRAGKTYFIPYEFITSGIFYDKSLFRKHSLSTPETWDELMDVCTKLKAAGVAPFAQDGTINTYNAYWYYWLANRELGGGALLKASQDKTGKAWDDPGFLNAAKRQYTLSKAGKDFFQDGYEGSQWPAAQITWSRGDAAMILNGTWIPNETAKGRPDTFEVGYFPFPAVPGGKGAITEVEAFLIGFAIPAKAKNPKLAKEFIKFFLKKTYQMKIIEMSQNIAARKDLPYPKVLQDVQPVLQSATKFHLLYDGTMARVPEWFSTVLIPLNNKLLFGSLTPEQFIQAMKEKTIAYWKAKN